MTTELVELADCPFCGSPAEFAKGGFGEIFAACTKCWCHMGGAWATDQETAAKGWNTRALASRAAVPDGFVLVPMEATFDMEDAGLRWMTAFQHMRKQDRRNAMANAYEAMLAAAPEPVAVG